MLYILWRTHLSRLLWGLGTVFQKPKRSSLEREFRDIAVLLKLLWWQKHSKVPKISFLQGDLEILQCCWNCCGDPGLSAIASHRWLFGSKTDALCHFDRCFYFARKRISFAVWKIEGFWKSPDKDMLWFAVLNMCIRWLTQDGHKKLPAGLKTKKNDRVS